MKLTKLVNLIIGNRQLVILLALGLIIRLTLALLPGMKIDVDAWYAWAERLNEVGFSQFYSDQIWTNYTPGYLYVLWILGFLKDFFQINTSVFYLILKLPSIISEIILGIFIYFIISKRSIVWAKIAAASILLNPALIFNTAVWGQIDGLFSLILILSVYYLNYKRYFLSSFLFSIGFLIKPQAILLLPVFALYFFNNLKIKNLAKFIIVTPVVILLLSLPFFVQQPLLGIVNLFLKMAGDYSATSLFAYNFWGAVGFWIPDQTIWNGLSYKVWGYILYFLYWIIVGYFYFKKRLSLYALATLFALSFFFLPTRVHERYLYSALIFLILYAATIKSRVLLILSAILSFIHLLNLYYVYVYYNELYLNLPRLLYNGIFYQLLDSSSKILSALSTSIFILITIVTIRTGYVRKKTKT